MGDNAAFAHAGQWFDSVVYSGRGAAFVCSYVAGDLFGVCGAEYAAAGDASDIGADTDADAFRRFNAYGKYAQMGAGSYADSSDYPLCGILSGNIVPWCRFQRGLETLCHAAGDWISVICIFALPFPEKRCSMIDLISPNNIRRIFYEK